MVRRRSTKAEARQPLDPSDPRSLDHPSHREQWLALARALGRLDAIRDFETLYGKAPPDDLPKIKTRRPRRADD
jgi:hypothetical protein